MIEQKTYHEIVLDAAKEVFETMIFMEIEPSAQASIDESALSLLGTITFKGDIEGCMGINLSWPCGQTIARNMLALEPDAEVSQQEVCDAVGEVANMVMGSIKSRLQDMYPDIAVSIPTVVTGRELNSNLGEGAEKVAVPVCLNEEFTAVFILLYRRK
ncbi:MAG: chemotaxis protein CheX [Anaerohalosphaeraceae bacterium]